MKNNNAVMKCAVCFGSSLFFFGFFLFMYLNNKPLYFHFGEEGTWFERFTFIFYLLASILCGVSLVKLWQYSKRNKLIRQNWCGLLWLALFTFFFFFIAGEEESWGQWMFGLKTPAGLQEINYQHEINLHNIGMFALDNHMILNLLILGFGILFPFFVFVPKVRSFLQKRMVIPPGFNGIWFFVFGLLYEKVANTFGKSWVHPEFSEYFFSIGFFVYTLTIFATVKTMIANQYNRSIKDVQTT